MILRHLDQAMSDDKAYDAGRPHGESKHRGVGKKRRE